MLDALIIQITSLFTMINPLAVIPMYIALTGQFSAAESRKVAVQAGVVSFITLAAFALLGKFVFDFFGISVPALKIVGGVLFFAMGYEMLRGKTVPKRLDTQTADDFGDDIAITPVAIPMITGPGAITMVLILMQQADTVIAKAEILLSIFIVIALTTTILMAGPRIIAFFGPSGTKVMMRLMGLIVMLIAVEFFFSGVTPYVVEIASKVGENL